MPWFKNHFGMVVSVVMTAILSTCMVSVAMPAFHMEINIVTWYTNFCVSFFSLFLTGILLPVSKWGSMMAGACHMKPQTLGFTIVSNIIPTFIFNTVATAVLPAVNIFCNPDIPAEAQFGVWLSGAISGWPLMFVVSFVLAMIGEAIAVKAALAWVPPMQEK